ncbi:FAD:protein FMN transferase [Gemmatimonadota bacterium]
MIIISIIVAVAFWQTRGDRDSLRHITLTTEPEGIMGTSCQLVVVTRPVDEELAVEALTAAERVLRGIELEVSSWLEGSQISLFNEASAGEDVALSDLSHTILSHAREAWRETGGAFDVTIRPLILLWRGSADSQILPTTGEVTRAREASSWDLIDLRTGWISKRADGAQVDLGGIAKGYAIDRAVEAMQAAGVEGGLVDVGGDLRVFGQPPDGRSWHVQIRDPAGSGVLSDLSIASGSVCTSGDYTRFNEISGVRYSHIIDPRTGQPVVDAVSVTVVATSALDADIWATTLSVLGPDGIGSLPGSVEAMMIMQTGTSRERVTSSSFDTYLDRITP